MLQRDDPARVRREAQAPRLVALAGLAAALAAFASVTPARAGRDAEPARDRLLIYATTDAAVVAPLLHEFAVAHPEIPVDYLELGSAELYDRFIGEAGSGRGSADLLWSSAMDLQLKLANDGYAQAVESAEAKALPAWAVWRSEAFGTTEEPLVFAYNKRLLAEAEVPQSHAELTKLLRAQPARFRGRVASYDPERSGLGYLAFTQDTRVDPHFAETLAAAAAVRPLLDASTAMVLARVESGEAILGFNLLGSYVAGRQGDDPALGIVFPRDYTLTVTRVALIPKAAKHPAAARVFLEYLLSQRGQTVLAMDCGLFPARTDVAATLGLPRSASTAWRRVQMRPSLLLYQDRAKRLEFLRLWQQALAR